MASKLEQKGTKGDRILAHLTPGEIVIPRPFAEDDDFRGLIAELFRESGVDFEEFIVGSGKNKINPETGYMEFGLFKSIEKSVRRTVKKVSREVRRVTRKIGEEARRIDVQLGLRPPKMPKPPPLPPPAAIPEVGAEAAEGAYRRARRRRGYTRTIITGALKPKSTGKKTVLG